MADGEATQTAFQTIVNYRSKGKTIPAELKDDLLFDALIELFAGQKRLFLMEPWVNAVKWFLLLVGPAMILSAVGFVWLLVTHQFAFP